METASEKYSGALEAILTDAVKLTSKDPRFKDRRVVGRISNERYWVTIDRADEQTVREVNTHPAIKEMREIFMQAELDWGRVVMPEKLTVAAVNGILEEKA